MLSALGPTSPRHPGDLPITRATEAIASAMRREGVKRLIAISTGTAVDPADGFDWKIWTPALLIRLAMTSSYRDIIGLARTVRASNLDWTMVRAAFLKSRPASMHLNVGNYGHTKHSMTLSREELAIFMFDQIANPECVTEWLRASVRASEGREQLLPSGEGGTTAQGTRVPAFS